MASPRKEETALDLAYAGTGGRLRRINSMKGHEHIKTLSLRGHSIKEISNLDGLLSLVDLDLSHNRIFSISNIFTLSKLRSLDLSHNAIVSLPPDVKHLRSLQALDLSHNNLDGLRHVHVLATIESLSTLSLHHNPMMERPGATQFVLHKCKGLLQFNTEPVTEADRRDARQRFMTPGKLDAEGKLSPHPPASPSSRRAASPTHSHSVGRASPIPGDVVDDDQDASLLSRLRGAGTLGQTAATATSLHFHVAHAGADALFLRLAIATARRNLSVTRAASARISTTLAHARHANDAVAAAAAAAAARRGMVSTDVSDTGRDVSRLIQTRRSQVAESADAVKAIGAEVAALRETREGLEASIVERVAALAAGQEEPPPEHVATPAGVQQAGKGSGVDELRAEWARISAREEVLAEELAAMERVQADLRADLEVLHSNAETGRLSPSSHGGARRHATEAADDADHVTLERAAEAGRALASLADPEERNTPHAESLAAAAAELPPTATAEPASREPPPLSALPPLPPLPPLPLPLAQLVQVPLRQEDEAPPPYYARMRRRIAVLSRVEEHLEKAVAAISKRLRAAVEHGVDVAARRDKFEHALARAELRRATAGVARGMAAQQAREHAAQLVAARASTALRAARQAAAQAARAALAVEEARRTGAGSADGAASATAAPESAVAGPDAATGGNSGESGLTAAEERRAFEDAMQDALGALAVCAEVGGRPMAEELQAHGLQLPGTAAMQARVDRAVTEARAAVSESASGGGDAGTKLAGEGADAGPADTAFGDRVVARRESGLRHEADLARARREAEALAALASASEEDEARWREFQRSEQQDAEVARMQRDTREELERAALREEARARLDAEAEEQARFGEIDGFDVSAVSFRPERDADGRVVVPELSSPLALLQRAAASPETGSGARRGGSGAGSPHARERRAALTRQSTSRRLREFERRFGPESPDAPSRAGGAGREATPPRHHTAAAAAAAGRDGTAAAGIAGTGADDAGSGPSPDDAGAQLQQAYLRQYAAESARDAAAWGRAGGLGSGSSGLFSDMHTRRRGERTPQISSRSARLAAAPRHPAPPSAPIGRDTGDAGALQGGHEEVTERSAESWDRAAPFTDSTAAFGTPREVSPSAMPGGPPPSAAALGTASFRSSPGRAAGGPGSQGFASVESHFDRESPHHPLFVARAAMGSLVEGPRAESARKSTGIIRAPVSQVNPRRKGEARTSRPRDSDRILTLDSSGLAYMKEVYGREDPAVSMQKVAAWQRAAELSASYRRGNERE